MKNGLVLSSWILLAILLLACGSCQTRPVEQEEDSTDRALAEALDRAVNDDWKDFYFSCDCSTESGRNSVEIYGSGTAIWAGRAQFKFDRQQLRTILGLVLEYDFPAMEETYGGKEDPSVPGEFAIRVTCLIQLTLDGISKQVAQLYGGRQSREMRQLAEEIIKFSEVQGREGVETESLQDALSKLATGELAPEILDLLVYRKPDPEALQAGVSGWLLRVQGYQASAQPLSPGGLKEPRLLDLDDASVRSLSSVLADLEVGDLPLNLYADDYTDLSLKVLQWKKSVQARQFAGMTPATHGQKQSRFDRLLETIAQLSDRVIDEGLPENLTER